MSKESKKKIKIGQRIVDKLSVWIEQTKAIRLINLMLIIFAVSVYSFLIFNDISAFIFLIIASVLVINARMSFSKSHYVREASSFITVLFLINAIILIILYFLFSLFF